MPPETPRYARAPDNRAPNRKIEPGDTLNAAFIGAAPPSTSDRRPHLKRHHAIVLELDFRADEGDLERRQSGMVADKRVCDSVRPRIHRAGDWHTVGLQPPSAQVLHRRLQTRSADVQHASSAAAVRSNSAASIG